ncbi:DUF2804 domain-containing protein [Planococcus maritimus]|uniref:DUF2804 domain-containing protein n=1 Tax=Planococcus maritimus TaxID=192421 RepID=UPI0007992F97|nr:DUF2804 domain-containing protein [Planococcus maritimus]KYG59657.1 hypothetical protein AY633_05290 [Planococcus maritimus]OED33359.1 hypothetical protein BHE17_13180 [Planococcus maritimus]
MQHVERELTEYVKLCDAKGQLNPNAIGYAKKPIIECNLTGNFMRKKKWNYWCVFGDEIVFSATICHLDYAALCFVYFLNYETQRFFEKTVMVPYSRNLCLSESVLDSSHFHTSDIFVHSTFEKGNTRLVVSIPDFDGEKLHASLSIAHPAEMESLNVVVPWNRQTFQFTAKHHALPTNGTVQIGPTRYDFDEMDSFSVLDYGRGVWPRTTVWNWGMASQRSLGKVIGLNFGGKWTDGTGMTENAFFVNGRMTKISEDVIFRYDKKDFKKPWLIHTKLTDDVKLTFTPFYERVSKSDARLVKSEVHQLFGYYNGYVRYADGKKLKIHQLLGSAEEHYAKW